MPEQEQSFRKTVLHKSAELLLEKEKIGRDEFEALFQSGTDVATETTEE